MREKFIGAIKARRKVRVTFYSKEDRMDLTRVCAPMDYGPSRRAIDQRNRYHLWDYESDEGEHTLSLLEENIQKLEVLGELFDPAEFVTWDLRKSPWFVKRDWESYS